jgi:hypothetical protein
MCDYSLQAIASRPAVVGETLVVTNFGTGSRGFGPAEDPNPHRTAVCCLPGTELAFAEPVKGFTDDNSAPAAAHTTAIFRQVNKEHTHQHHDCLEFPDGRQVMLTYLCEGQKATVLQLPAAPKNEAEAKEQTRLEVVG